jgi:hypothetical protein
MTRFEIPALALLTALAALACDENPGGPRPPAEPLVASAYSMRNGEVGDFTYLDDLYTGDGGATALSQLTGGVGDLTDGVVAAQSWRSEPGPYVGWGSTDPVVAFHFCGPVQVEAVSVYVDAPVGDDGNVRAPSEVHLLMGGETVVHPVSVPAEGPVEIRLDGLDLVGRSLEITLVRQGWIMLSEVSFRGWWLADAHDAGAGVTCLTGEAPRAAGARPRAAGDVPVCTRNPSCSSRFANGSRGIRLRSGGASRVVRSTAAADASGSQGASGPQARARSNET